MIKPEKLGTIWICRAKLYGEFQGESGVLLGHCIDTPNGIAKALMELPNADMVYQCLDKKWSWRKDYLNRMNKWNDAKSDLVKI